MIDTEASAKKAVERLETMLADTNVGLALEAAREILRYDMNTKAIGN